MECFDKNFHSWTLRGYCQSAEELIPKIQSRIEYENYDVIFIDPLYKLMGGRDENSAGDIGTLLNEVEKLSVNAEAAIIMSAHFTKGNVSGRTAMDRIAGSGVYARDSDSIITLSDHEVERCLTVDVKCRNFAEPESDRR